MSANEGKANGGLESQRGAAGTVNGSAPLGAPGGKQEDGRKRARSGSVVSFKEPCDELYEVDLEAAKTHGRHGPTKPPAVFSLRYYIMMLALVSPFIVTYSKTIINFAIIDMIHPEFVGRKSSPARENPLTVAGAAAAEGQQPAAYFDLDNSCPVSEQVRARLLQELSEDTRRARETVGEKFEWDTDKQGLLKAAYSIGHMFLQVLGGRLSEIYGPQLIMSMSAALIALACLSAPLLASSHFYLLFADLFALGCLGGFMTPSLITLFTKWLTPSEKSLMMNFYLISSRLGYALSSLLCGLLIDAQLSWRYLFYSAGWVALGFGLVFFLCARNTPQEHPLMGRAELKYLAAKNTLVREALAAAASRAAGGVTELKPVGGAPGAPGAPRAVAVSPQELPELQEQPEAKKDIENPSSSSSNNNNNNNNNDNKTASKQHNKSRAAPWGALLTNAPVWAFIITKFCVKLAGDTVQIEMPAYLKRVMHLEPNYNGYINSANYVIFCLSCFAVGMLAKTANKRRPFGWSKTVIRKLFQAVASFGVALVLLAASFAVCNETWTLALFMAMFFFTTFSTGGEAQIPLDLSERYAGTIHALGSSLAISGALEPILVGYFLRGHASDRDRWAYIWVAAGSMALLGGLVFLIFGEAKIQPFDGAHTTTNSAEPIGRAPEAPGAGHDNKTFVSDDTRAAPANGKQKTADDSPGAVENGVSESVQI